MVTVEYVHVNMLQNVARDQYKLATNEELQTGSVVCIEPHAPSSEKELKRVVSIFGFTTHKADAKQKVYNVLLEPYHLNSIETSKKVIGKHEEESE